MLFGVVGQLGGHGTASHAVGESILHVRGGDEAVPKFLVHVGETITDLQILGCKLQQNAFSGWAPPGHAGGCLLYTSDAADE